MILYVTIKISTMKRLIFLGLTLVLAGYSASSPGQVDTEFWFVVPEISHRGNTGGTPGTLRIATLELDATVTIEMPANSAFTPIVLNIPANDEAAVDLTSLFPLLKSTAMADKLAGTRIESTFLLRNE